MDKRLLRLVPILSIIIGLLASGVLPVEVARAHGPGSGATIRLAPVEAPKGSTGPLAQVDLPQPEGGVRLQADEFGKPIDLKMLVLSADGAEAGLPAITTTLEYLGTPYTVVNFRQQPGWMQRSNLTDEVKGFYQGVILATGTLVHSVTDPTTKIVTYPSALTDPEWQILWKYERDFSVRQVTWYTTPTADFGYGPTNPTWGSDSGAAGIAATVTITGYNKVFKYLNPAAKVNITYAWTYQAKINSPDTTPILVDASGNALASIRNYPDGRENLAMTFDSNQYQNHMVLLNYGVINWVAKGLFLGERHIFLAAQNDDLFIPDELWDTKQLTTTDKIYRMKGDDVRALVSWQNAINNRPTTKSVKMQYAFNAIGTTSDYETDKSALDDPGILPLATPLQLYPKPLDDKASLTTAIRQNQLALMFINHTWDHTNLDVPISYDETLGELMRNINQATLMGLSFFSPKNLVTPDVSGLKNPAALDAMRKAGVKNLVSDTSRPGENNPRPNVGIPNWSHPDIYMIPRYPTNLFYNVGTPNDWTSEYNFLYRSYWGRNLTYPEILDKESDVILGYLIRGNINPLMFHQTNTRFYSKTQSLQTDLLDRVFQKYDALFAIPILSLQMDDIGNRMRQKGDFLDSGVTATWNPATKVLSITTVRPTSVPVTGIRTGKDGEELYAAQYITRIDMLAGTTISRLVTNRGTPVGGAQIQSNNRTVSASSGDEPSYEYESSVESIDYSADTVHVTAENRAYYEVNVPAVSVNQ